MKTYFSSKGFDSIYQKIGVRGKDEVHFQRPEQKKTAERYDRAEFSGKKAAQTDENALSALSGRDILEIKKGSGENQYRIFLPDSAEVSRVVSRGYVDVNGRKIELSEDVKEKLTKVDRLAQQAREKSFAFSTIKHDFEVAQQQYQAVKKQNDKATAAFAVAAKMSGGKKVSPEEEKILMDHDPQMYLMAKIAQSMSENQKEDKNEIRLKKYEDSPPSEEEEEQITFKTEMTVDTSAGTADADSIVISSDFF